MYDDERKWERIKRFIGIFIINVWVVGLAFMIMYGMTNYSKIHAEMQRNKEVAAKQDYTITTEVINSKNGREADPSYFNLFDTGTNAQYVVKDTKKNKRIVIEDKETIAKYQKGDEITVHYSKYNDEYSITN